MPQQYYTLDEAAKLLRIPAEQLKELARKKEIRAFQDRSGWRFRSQEIDEMARERGFGSDPELPLGEAAKAKAGDSGRGNEVFNFSLGADESDEVPLGKQPVSTEKPSRSGSGSGSRKGSGSKAPPKASSDSDVRLVLEGSDLNFATDTGSSKAPASKGPVSPAPKVGSSKSRMAPPVQDDSGVRIVPLDQPSDSDVTIEKTSPHDSAVPMSGRKVTKRASDSDIRIEEVEHGAKVDQNVTEEIDLDAEERKAKEKQAKTSRHRPKPASSPALPTKSPFELSESEIDVNGPAADADTDSSSDFELKPMADSSSPIEVSSDELLALKSDDDVSLGEMTGGKGASGINLRDPADSGISLEPGSSEEMDLSLSLESGNTPKPASKAKSETDSSSDFDLNVDEGSSSPTEGSSSEFELSLQDDDASPTDGSSSEFELSLDAEGAGSASGSDSDSEFELSLDDSGGLSVEQDAAGDSDFDMASLNEESDSEAVALDEGETDLESSEFDLSLEGEESGSQVVPLEDEEEVDEGAATVQRRAAGATVAGDDVGDELDDDLDGASDVAEEVEPAAASAAAAPPADWGVMVPLVSLLSTIVLFVVTLMSFELIQGMWGYHTGNKVSNMIIHPIAKMVSGEDKLPEN